MPMYSEQRKHSRVPVYAEVKYDQVAEDITEHIINISRGGLFIETFSPSELGTLLKISFYLPDSGHTFEVTGAVVWSRKLPTAAGPPGMGIEFKDINPHDADMLEGYINSKLTLE